MSYLDCAQYDCCHNKAGCCCLNDIKVHHTGESDAVCSSYRKSPETEIACDDRGCRPQQGLCCCASHVSVDTCSCGPACATRAPR